ncbi:MAG: family 16 glycoside hydrolase [Limisphaerales bacterium]
MTYHRLILALSLAVVSPLSGAEWISLFDGKTFAGWKPSENKDSWQIVDGALAAKGKRSHLFYDGDVSDHRFKNFELSVDVKAEGNANAGIYFHTEYQEKGWPNKGFEFQVINTDFKAHETKNDYVERKKTGSLYGVRNLGRSPVKNDEWFNYRIIVRGKTIRGYVNGRLTVDYTEPDKPFITKPGSCVLDDGTFAFQCHDPHSVVLFKNIKVLLLPDDVKTPGKPLNSEVENRLRTFGKAVNLPTPDFHVHLGNGLTAERLMRHARRFGFTYGIALTGDATMKPGDLDLPPETYLGLQAEGRGWTKKFSESARKRFDYIFTDDMAWANGAGKVADQDKFMDELVSRMVKIVKDEPIDFFANATYLPKALDYDALWTDQRMGKVIKALVANEVAVEINAKRKIPSARFIKQAKAAGVKFTFGTDNSGAKDLGRLDYCLQMAAECKLKRADFWFPN